METSRVVVRPAPQFEHPGHWASSCDCADAAGRRVPGGPQRSLRAVPVYEPPAPPDGAAVSAREFTIAAMTVVLEVISRRRPVTALGRFTAPAVTDHVLSRGRARYESRGSSPAPRLRRVHIQLVADGAEFFGSYQCGARVRAFAGRLAAVTEPGRPGWRVQTLMLD